MNLKPEEKAIGQENYHSAVAAADAAGKLDPTKVDRRDFLKGVIAAGAVSGAGLGAMYFGYGDSVDKPVRVGIIGTGDEGNVLIGAITPKYVQVVAIADIRPSSIHRAFHGDYSSPVALAARTGLMSKYGWKTEDEAKEHVEVYSDYEDLLKDPNVEAVIIALPLHLHAKATVAALKKGKHVLTEKLMAHNIAQCKVMGRFAEQQNLLLATGHQRHYSVLYDNAVKLFQWGVLGEIQHIRAQWHRGNLPGNDSWAQPLPGGEMGFVKGKKERIDEIAKELKEFEEAVKKVKDPSDEALLKKKVAQWKAWNSDQIIKPEDYDYGLTELANGRKVSPMEELVRWRLFDRTGGGLMAELGSHQLDAASIFCSALRKDGKKAHPLTVHCIGGRHTFPEDRDADDHVYCMFEFPGPGYAPEFKPGYYDPVNNYPHPDVGILPFEKDPNKRIVVTYSSIMGNGFGGYGETVMCSKGTLILEREQEVMLFKGSDTSTKVGVKDDKGGPTLDTQQSGRVGALAKAAAEMGPVSRGYTEEIEHWAYCIRNPSESNQPRCPPDVAMGDAIIALTARVAMKNNLAGKGGYIQFQEEWYDMKSAATPDGSSVEKEWEQLVGGSLPG